MTSTTLRQNRMFCGCLMHLRHARIWTSAVAFVHIRQPLQSAFSYTYIVYRLQLTTFSSIHPSSTTLLTARRQKKKQHTMHFSLLSKSTCLSLLLALAAIVPSSLAARPRRGNICSTTAPVNATREAELAPFIAAEKKKPSSKNERRAPRIINVYFHVIHSGSTGKLSGAAIQSQLRVLNQDYAQANYQFKLAATTYTNNNTWFTTIADQTSPAHFAMKRKLRRSGKGDLNCMVFCPSLTQGVSQV
ncbi:hypothetical protein V8E36_006479 [Tilletia maclaganii]